MNSRAPPLGRGRGGGRFGRGGGRVGVSYYPGRGGDAGGGYDNGGGARGIGGRGGVGRFIPRGGGGGPPRFDGAREYGGVGRGGGGRGGGVSAKYDSGGGSGRCGYGGGRGGGVGGGGGSRYNNDDDGRRGLGRMSSYSSLGRPIGGGGPPPPRGSYAEMAKMMPSYADLGRDISDKIGIRGNGMPQHPSDRGGAIRGGGGSVDGSDNNRGGAGGGGGGCSDISGVGSYAMMGELMSHQQPPHHPSSQQQQQAGMKRLLPLPNENGPSQMLGGPISNTTDDHHGGPLPPQRVDRLLPGGVPLRGGGGLPPLDNTEGNMKRVLGEWDRDGPPDNRILPRGVGDNRSSSSIPPSLQEQDPFGRFSRVSEPSSLTRPPLEEDQFGRQRPPPRFADRGAADKTFGRPLSSGADQRSSGGISGVGSGHHHSNSLLMNGRFVPDDSRSSTSVEDNRLQQQPQHPLPGSPLRREASYNNSMAQRFDGPDHGNINSSSSSNINRCHPPPVPARSNDRLVSTMPIMSCQHTPSPLQQQQQQHLPLGRHSTNATTCLPGSNVNCRHLQQYSLTPRSIKLTGTLKNNQVNFIPQSPTSPPPSKPSSHALAMSRMIEMNADMHFAYTRLMMLEVEHQRVEARLGTLEKLSSSENNKV